MDVQNVKTSVGCVTCRKACRNYLMKPAVLGVSLVLGNLMLVVGIVLVFVFPSMFRSRIAGSMPLVNGSFTFKAWSSATTPIYMQFWLFNITNPVEFLAGERPIVEQIGPFTYQEKRQKLGVAFNASDSVLKYQQVTTYHFRRDMSCCWEDTNITTLNIMYVSLTYKMRFISPFSKRLADGYLRSGRHGLIMTRTVGEILWGYHDTALSTLKPVLGLLNYHISSEVGLFSSSNGSAGGEYEIHTGAGDVSRLGNILSWNGANRLQFWNSTQANMINGTDGAMFPPFVTRSDLLYLFSSDICRSIYLKYTRDVMLHNAVPLYRFQAPADMFMNATLNPSNIGFCPHGRCLDSGVLNISGCKDGAPAIMSQPHFYQAAAQYQEAVTGISPGPEFDTVLDVEPNTGLVMRAAKKLQLNMAVFHSEFTQLQRLPDMQIVPLLWLNESACLDAESAAKFRAGVLQPRETVAQLQASLIVLGSLLATAALAGIFVRCRRRNHRKPSASPSSSASPLKQGSLAGAAGNGDGDNSEATLLGECGNGNAACGGAAFSAAAAADSSHGDAETLAAAADPNADTAETVIGAGA